MIGAALAILTASLLGSVHCAAMCGGFVCMYSSGVGRDAATLRSHALYNVGRLVSYVLLGALAGALGVGLTHAGNAAGVANAATVVAGALMVLWGISTIAAQKGYRIGARLPAVSAYWQRTVGGMLNRIRNQSVGTRALLTGLGTTLLPCGWLYVFVATAGGTGSVRDGVLVMAIFWLGTVPALVAIGLGAQRVFGPLRRKLPALGAAAVVLMGVLALNGRLFMTPHGH